MIERIRRQLSRATLMAVAALAFVLAWSGLVRGGALPTPAPLGSVATLPPISATATPAPSGQIIRYAAQLIDVRNGFAFFTTGDAFRLAPNYALRDAATNGPTTLQPVTRIYARASFDTGSGAIVELALSKKPLPQEASYQSIEKFAVAVSTPFPNPDLKAVEGYNGKPVLVVITVEVPPTTPFSDNVYIATDTSGWSPTAIKLNRIDSLHYRIATTYASGTKLLYRYTRGSWPTSERGQNGLQVTHSAIVPNLDVKRLADTVYAWADINPNNPNPVPNNGVNGLPTPYNPIPFVTPPRTEPTHK
ncbi:MAG TPA: hypothetical protein VKG44_04785 [Candidatus Baltobacteraceae bacterium]|nr:hypothetical protein [Candidatus Baltobacteraceae bacterium]